MHKSEKISILGVILSIFLFASKLIFGLISNSLSLISDSINSLLDIFSYSGIYFAVKISNKKADKSHPFGHKRAEPIAGLIIAVFTVILGFKIISNAIQNIISPKIVNFSLYSILVLIIAILVKIFMALYLIKKGKELKRPALKAAGVDSRNDVFASIVALVGVIGPGLGFLVIDSIASILISLFILYSGYEIASENINYLMGRAPPEKTIEKIKQKTLKVRGVKGFNDVKAHYVGPYVHVEIHIEVNKKTEKIKLNTKRSHNIGKKVQYAVEALDEVDKAFIHIDPISV